MGIPESQLDTWSHQGAIPQSSTTYNTIKNVLESSDSGYADKNYDVFLQGSYGNDTNIYAESDVDVVIKLNDCFRKDLKRLPSDQQVAYQAVYSSAIYTHTQFKNDVLSILKSKYGNSVNSGGKAINIAASGNRRKADVVAAIEYRKYNKFLGEFNQSYDEGICFFSGSGEEIINYPKQHSINCTAKHQASGTWFKPMVRIMKNMRSKLVDDRTIEPGLAPSYYIEGLLYNVPNEHFGKSYRDTFYNSMQWLLKTDRSLFVCANERYKLLYENSPVTWRDSKCTRFLDSLVKLWDNW